MKKYLKTLLYLLVAILVGVTAVYATSKLTPPGSVTNTMYSLTDIYNLANGTSTTEGSGTIETTPGTIAETGKTLTEVYNAVASALAGASGGGLPQTGQTGCWDTAGDPVACAGTGQDGDTLSGATRAYTDHENGTVTDTATGLMWVKDPMQIIPWTTDKGIWATETGYTVGDLVNDPDACGSTGCTFWVAQTVHTSGTGTFAEDRVANPTYWTETVWARNDDGVWQGSTWQEALTNCGALNYGGHTDWRLPNINELHSLVNYQNINPAIDTTAFPNTQSNYYWSSTSYQGEGNRNLAWIVFFYNGYVGNDYKGNQYPVRCVR